MGEIALETRTEDFVGGKLDVVLDAFELEALLLRVVNGVARAVVEVARLPDRADRHDVLLVGREIEVDGGHLFDAPLRQRAHFTEMRMPYEGDVPELFPERQALARLLR